MKTTLWINSNCKFANSNKDTVCVAILMKTRCSSKCTCPWEFIGGKHEDLIELPGGHIKQNESLKEAAKREIFEETGIEINIDKLKFVREIEKENGGKDTAFCILISDCKNNELSSNSDLKEVKWHSHDCELGFTDLAYDHKAILNKARKLLK